MKIKDVAVTLERFAPLPLQESYDNAGLQIGLTEAEDVSGVLLCLDVTEDVISEAERQGCNLVVSHHPLIFRPLRHIAIYSAHTNLDNAPGGVNFMIAEKLGLSNVRFLQPAASGNGGSGVIGNLPSAVSPTDFVNTLAATFKVDGVMHNTTCKSQIHTVALCGGAGDFLLDDAVKQGADAFMTGEMSYHRFFGHEHDLLIAVLGHYQSEQYTIELLHRILHEAHPTLRVLETTINTNPITIN